MPNRAKSNRPFKFGARDRREYIVQDGEVSLVAINDDVGNPIYLGRAKVGTALSDDKWQIRFMTWDDNGSITRMTWPQNNLGSASTEFEFVWNDDTDLTITNITQANPAVVTVSAAGTIQNGDEIIIQDVVGMTQVNLSGTNTYTVAGLAGNTFQLNGIDSTAFTAYSSGGTVTFGSVINLIYS